MKITMTTRVKNCTAMINLIHVHTCFETCGTDRKQKIDQIFQTKKQKTVFNVEFLANIYITW